jgi:hypothetical protein
MTLPAAPAPGPAGPTHLFPLPVWATVGATLRSWLGLLGHVVRLGLVPYLILAAITVLQFEVLPADPAASMIAGLVMLFPYTLFAVAWHRLVLLGPPAAPSWSLRFERRHWRFVGLLVALYVLMYLSAGAALAVIGLISSAMQESAGGGLLLSLVVIAVVLLAMTSYVRLTFVFPATAVDERFGFQEAWRVTKGCGFRLLAIFVMVGLITAIPVAIVQGILLSAYLPETTRTGTAPEEATRAFLVPALVLQALYMPVIAASITALSISFRTRTGWIPGPPATT